MQNNIIRPRAFPSERGWHSPESEGVETKTLLGVTAAVADIPSYTLQYCECHTKVNFKLQNISNPIAPLTTSSSPRPPHALSHSVHLDTCTLHTVRSSAVLVPDSGENWHLGQNGIRF